MMESFDSFREKQIKQLTEDMRKLMNELIDAGMKPEDVEKLVSDILMEEEEN